MKFSGLKRFFSKKQKGSFVKNLLIEQCVFPLKFTPKNNKPTFILIPYGVDFVLEIEEEFTGYPYGDEQYDPLVCLTFHGYCKPNISTKQCLMIGCSIEELGEINECLYEGGFNYVSYSDIKTIFNSDIPAPLCSNEKEKGQYYYCFELYDLNFFKVKLKMMRLMILNKRFSLSK